MTKSQEKTLDRIIEEALCVWEVTGVTTTEMSKEYPFCKLVSVSIRFGSDCPYIRRSAHLFIGSHGGITYPVQTGPKQVERKFDWDFARVVSEQEDGWVDYDIYHGLR